MIARTLAGAVVLATLAAIHLTPSPTSAQIAADRPIRVIMPYSAGGPADVTVRMLGQKIAAAGGPAIVVENRTGGGGVVAAVAAKQAAPDGTTLFLADFNTLAINPALMPDLAYDPVRDFQPVTLLYSFPSLLVVPASVEARTVAELVALAKKTPGGLSYGSQGQGSGGHLLAEMFGKATGAPLVHVPYRGSAPAYADLVAARVAMMFGSYGGAQGFLADNRLRALAVPSKKRLPALPDVPTLAELGYPDLDLDAWFGLAAPAGTSDAMTRALRDLFANAITAPDIASKLEAQGIVVVANTPAEFAALIKADITRMGPVVKASGAKAN